MAVTTKGGVAGNLLEVELASLGARVVPFPADPGALGAYRKALRVSGGAITAGMAGGATVYTFRYGGANLCIIKKILLTMGDTATAFTAGLVSFDAFVARGFTANDTGGTAGTLTVNNAKLRTSYATTGVSNIQIIAGGANTGIAAGTRTLDTDPFASVQLSIPATAGQPLAPTPIELYRAGAGEETLTLAVNEGFIINGTVPATGTWQLAVDVTWLERTAWV